MTQQALTGIVDRKWLCEQFPHLDQILPNSVNAPILLNTEAAPGRLASFNAADLSGTIRVYGISKDGSAHEVPVGKDLAQAREDWLKKNIEVQHVVLRHGESALNPTALGVWPEGTTPLSDNALLAGMFINSLVTKGAGSAVINSILSRPASEVHSVILYSDDLPSTHSSANGLLIEARCLSVHKELIPTKAWEALKGKFDPSLSAPAFSDFWEPASESSWSSNDFRLKSDPKVRVEIVKTDLP